MLFRSRPKRYCRVFFLTVLGKASSLAQSRSRCSLCLSDSASNSIRLLAPLARSASAIARARAACTSCLLVLMVSSFVISEGEQRTLEGYGSRLRPLDCFFGFPTGYVAAEEGGHGLANPGVPNGRNVPYSGWSSRPPPSGLLWQVPGSEGVNSRLRCASCPHRRRGVSGSKPILVFGWSLSAAHHHPD